MKTRILKVFLILVFGINYAYCFSDTVNEDKKDEITKFIDSLKDKNSINLEKSFNRIIADGICWRQIAEQFVKKLNGSMSAEFKNELIDSLIDYRYTLSSNIYLEAAKQLFPTYYFTIIPTPEGFVTRKEDGGLIYRKKWYTIKIYNGYSFGYNLEKLHCTVTISALGGLGLYSDLDSSVTVTGAEALDTVYLPHDFDVRGVDYNELIKNELIKKFNEISQKKYKMTSNSSLSSNIYTDAPLKVYPKFNKKIVLEGRLLIHNAENFYKENIKKKHIYEQAASIVPIKNVLNDSEWEDFKKNVIKKLETLLPEVGRLHNLEKVKKDFNEICDFASFLLSYKNLNINAKIEKIKNSEYGQNSPLKYDKQSWENDMLITTMNELYSEHLEAIPTLGNKIIKINIKIKKLLENVKALLIELKIEKNVLKNMNKVENIFYKSLSDLKFKIGVMEKKYKKEEKNIKNLMLERANLNNERQLAQIKASLFAYDAYINHSAPYHVVKGLQGYKNIKITSQIIKGSILQNVGFRLLQSELDRLIGLDEGNIAYRNAKYGQRVADLIFGQGMSSYSDSEIELIVGLKKKLKILPSLQAKNMQWENLFSREEYHLLNSEIKIVEQVKNNINIAYDEKGSEAFKLLINRFEIITKKFNPTEEELKNYIANKEKELYLSIATKVIASVYLARLEKTNGCLWGEAF